MGYPGKKYLGILQLMKINVHTAELVWNFYAKEEIIKKLREMGVN